MKAGKILMCFLLGCVVSGFFFPFGPPFFPSSLNTKQVIGVLGILAFLFRCIRTRAVTMQRNVLISALIAIVFSIWCYFCITANGTDDTTYAEYWVSFAVWLGGAYGVVSMLKAYHGSCNLQRLTNYLAVVCVAQCFIALAIDNSPVFSHFVDNYISSGNEFCKERGRLYGVGCSLDPAGIKFSAVLLLISHQICSNREVSSNKGSLWWYLIMYAIIVVLGNMIARTTTVGAVMGLVYMLVSFGIVRRGVLTGRQLRFLGIFLSAVTIAAIVSVMLYRTNAEFRYNMRFGFEGFFNFFETGEFRTDSTDKLNTQMWIWPADTRSWLIGTGLFGNFVYSTDIGYCRFILYCGLIGMAIFSAFFIYNGLSVVKKFRNFSFMSIMLISLTFVIWIKVATDIFLINALLFCIDGDPEEIEDESYLSDSGHLPACRDGARSGE